MKRRAAIVIAAVGFPVLAVWGFAAVKAPPEISQTQTEAGYTVHIDPVTGEFITPHADQAPQDYGKAVDEALSRSVEGLQAVPAPAGGGKMFNLQGRFQNTYTAAIDTDGKLTIECDDDENTNSEKE